MATNKNKSGNVPNLRFPDFSDEWERKKLGDVCKMQAGKFVSASEINPKPDTDLFPCYGGNGLRGYTKSFNQDGKFSLIGRQGALCGNVTLANGKFHATEHAVVVTPNMNMDTEWMFYLLIYLNLNQYATGQAQPGLSVQNIENVEVTISSSKQEQQRVASFLSLIDIRIQTQNKIIEELRVLKAAIAKKVFSQELRFSEFTEKWENKSLGDIAEKKSSNISANSLDENTGIYKIYGATGLLKTIDFYREEQPYISIVKDGAGIGRLFLCEGKTSVLGTLDIIRNNELSYLTFLYYVLGTIDFSKYTIGSTIPHIYFKDYASEIIMLPSLKEQIKIATFLSAIDQKIDNEVAILNQLAQQKQYLLQQMFI